MMTIKLKIQNTIDITEYQRQFSCLVRYAYNRILDGKTAADIRKLCKTLNNVGLMDGSWAEFAYYRADRNIEVQKALHPDNNVVFGGKKNFSDYSNGKITEEEYRNNRLSNLLSIGKKHDPRGNRKFQLDLANNKVIFKPSRDTHIDVILPRLSKNQKKLLEQVEMLGKNHEMPITYELSSDHICIKFDEAYCSTPYHNFKKDRVLAIDTNPNFLGITICDYNLDGEQKVLHKEIISNAEINALFTTEGIGLPSTHPFKKYITQKRIHEGHEVAKYISVLARSWNCEYVALEKLNIKQRDIGKGKTYNRKCNNMWNRLRMFDGIKKWCSLKNIKVHDVPPQHSSFIGCINYTTDYDMIAASLEISRRANAFISNYRTKTKDHTNHIVYPAIEKKKILNEWKDEGLTAKDFSNWVDLYGWFKQNPELNYRVLLDVGKTTEKSFRLFSQKSKLKIFRIL